MYPVQRNNMTKETIRAVPLNLFIFVFGAGFLLLVFCLIFCCYFLRLKQQEHYRRRGYRKVMAIIHYQESPGAEHFLPEGMGQVVLKAKAKKSNLVGQVCAVCLEEFKVTEELGLCPCTHAFHTKCLMKWLEVRNACPMCNRNISLPIQRPSLEPM